MPFLSLSTRFSARRRSPSGFSLIELLGAVGLIGVISAIALPGLLRARMSGNEASAIASLRAISSAQSAFAASCGAGFYAPTLTLLGTPPVDGNGPAFVSEDLNTDPSYKSTYEMYMVAGSPATGAPESCNGAAQGAVVASYFAGAAPANDGFRYFGTNQGGTIYTARVVVPPTQFGVPPGTEPVQ
tara:strand:+ start:41 stop:598 length:558 start_codon:yes stop_codon:yes gene_type:complete